MTHRAGFTYFFFPANPLRGKYKELGIDRVDNLSADEMLQKLATLPLAFSPGTSSSIRSRPTCSAISSSASPRNRSMSR